MQTDDTRPQQAAGGREAAEGGGADVLSDDLDAAGGQAHRDEITHALRCELTSQCHRKFGMPLAPKYQASRSLAAAQGTSQQGALLCCVRVSVLQTSGAVQDSVGQLCMSAHARDGMEVCCCIKHVVRAPPPIWMR